MNLVSSSIARGHSEIRQAETAPRRHQCYSPFFAPFAIALAALKEKADGTYGAQKPIRSATVPKPGDEADIVISAFDGALQKTRLPV